ncbi:MAG: SagB/ThcOx family dehydrogenase [Candidatus Theseobacter exili]|nr:SagB/ThcOx family dehydrogenase [Candidatus Theseobacter exili]
MKKMCIFLWILVFKLLVITDLSFCQDDSGSVRLPVSRDKSKISVEEAINSRKSVRSFADIPLSLQEVSQLLWAAVGRIDDSTSGATRAYPSAGGIYPLKAFLVAGKVNSLDSGVYWYDWREHQLVRIVTGDKRAILASAALGQSCVKTAPATIVLVADFSAVKRFYGNRGRDRYISMDAGHAGQNISLQAEALGLGTVAIGAFHDEEVKKILQADNAPVYLFPVGKKE